MMAQVNAVFRHGRLLRMVEADVLVMTFDPCINKMPFLTYAFPHLQGYHTYTDSLPCNISRILNYYMKPSGTIVTVNDRFPVLSTHLREPHHHIQRTIFQSHFCPLSDPPSPTSLWFPQNTLSRP
jgi:hypothetical protein